MSVPSAPSTKLLNLEKELICFICTEILYQPLTLLDCLHTFCGSCLKEWFAHQHRKASHSHTPNPTPYTCPTCRADVKDAQHNAMITTLLEMFLAANPDRDRDEEEKAEMAKIYKPRENILPKVESRRHDRRRREHGHSGSRDSRSTDAPRDRSRRREPSASALPYRTDERPSPGLLSPAQHHSVPQARSSSHDHDQRRERRRQERSERREQREPSGNEDQTSSGVNVPLSPPQSPPLVSPRHPDAVEARSRSTRSVVHQASLRSIVSASDSGTGTGDSLDEARLMQEILAAGLLDGIDVDSLTEAEQDELSEEIARRYRELHAQQAQQSQPTSGPASPEPTSDIASAMQNLGVERDSRERRRSTNSAARDQTDRQRSRSQDPSRSPNRPPISYTTTSDVGSSGMLGQPARADHRRSSDQGSRPQARLHRSTHPGVSPVPATRSATDLSETTATEVPRRLSSDQRASTEPRRSPRHSPRASRTSQATSPPELESPRRLSPSSTSAVLAIDSASVPTASRAVPQDGPAEVDGTSAPVTTQFEEPTIDCYRCGRAGIQYEVYKHCTPCSVDLCMRCFRAGRGCNHWFGFGFAAQAKFDSSHPRRVSRSMELPHLLVGRQYRQPPEDSILSSQSRLRTTSDPAMRLQEGHFCDRCGKFANSCFWSCDYCNDGEWGFCNDCVNTHHCCSHALLPIAHKLCTPGATTSRTYDPHVGSLGLTLSEVHATSARPFNSRSSPAHSAPSSATSTTDAASAGPLPDFVNLSITTHCDVCTSPIPPSDSRYHCPTHPSPTASSPSRTGDYDICAGCYHNLIKIGRITRDAGPAGWRKCPSGHRMILTAFESSESNDAGQLRVVLQDLVGGLKMSEQDIAIWQQKLDSTATTTTAPPSSFNNKGQWTWLDTTESTDSSQRAPGNRRTRSKKAAHMLPETAGVTAEGKKAKKRFPPDGGFGKVCRAMWSYYPEEGEGGHGELMFPKGAVVAEVEDINEEWGEGVYAGERGLVPMVYVREE